MVVAGLQLQDTMQLVLSTTLLKTDRIQWGTIEDMCADPAIWNFEGVKISLA